MPVEKFADLVAGSLKVRSRAPTKAMRAEMNSHVLKRIVNDKGYDTKQVSKKQKTGKHHRASIGSGKQQTCFICRVYRKNKYSYTTWCCSICKTPLCCAVSKSHPLKEQNGDYEHSTCVEHHINSCHGIIKCNGTMKGRATDVMRKKVGAL